MQNSTLGAIGSFTIQCGAGAAMVIWPEKTWIAVWVLIFSTLPLLFSIGWWIRAKFFPQIFSGILYKNQCAEYISANEVVRYMAEESVWGIEKQAARNADGFRYNVRLEALPEFQRLAQEGTIEVKGRLGGQGLHQAIPADFWRVGSIDENAFIRQQRSRTRPTVISSTGVPDYDDLLFNKKDVYRAWPTASKAAIAASERERAAYRERPVIDPLQIIKGVGEHFEEVTTYPAGTVTLARI